MKPDFEPLDYDPKAPFDQPKESLLQPILIIISILFLFAFIIILGGCARQEVANLGYHYRAEWYVGQDLHYCEANSQELDSGYRFELYNCFKSYKKYANLQ